jgi:hypothetical protein
MTCRPLWCLWVRATRFAPKPALYDIEMVGGIKTGLFGGEGLFLASMTGPGRIWIQTLPFSRLADRILSAFHGSKEELRVVQPLPPLDIEARKSWFVLVFDIRESSSSIASTGDSGVSTLRSTHTRFRSSFWMRSSSFRVPLF